MSIKTIAVSLLAVVSLCGCHGAYDQRVKEKREEACKLAGDYALLVYTYKDSLSVDRQLASIPDDGAPTSSALIKVVGMIYEGKSVDETSKAAREHCLKEYAEREAYL